MVGQNPESDHLNDIGKMNSFMLELPGSVVKDDRHAQLSKNNTSPDKELSEDPGYGWRHLQLLLMFAAILGQLTHRSCLSVAMVAMTEEITPGQEVFSWTREQQGTMLSAFLWGYACTQIPAGYLTTRFGAKVIYGTSIISSSVVSLCIPMVARQFGWIGVTVIRVLTGLVQGVTFPGAYFLLGKWAVPQERGRASAFTTAALSGGIFISMSLSGYIAVTLGWESIFYVFGCLTLVIGILWFVFSADSPDVHPWISDKERRFILDAIEKESKTTKGGRTPWREIFTSGPFLSVIASNAGFLWGLYLLLTALPRYMSDMFQLSISLNGVVSGAPYILNLVVAIFSGWISDKLIKKGKVTTGFIRKLLNTIGFWGPAILLTAITFTPNNYRLIQVTELTLTVALIGASFGGYMVNFVDLSPRFSGLIMSISNCVASLFSGVAPLTVGLFISAFGETEGWAASFYLTAAILFVTNLIWIIFGSTDQQPWNNVQEEQDFDEKPQSNDHSEG